LQRFFKFENIDCQDEVVQKELKEESYNRTDYLKVKYEEEGLWLLNQMKDMVGKVGLLESDIELIDEKIEELKNPELTIGARLLKEYQKENDMAKVGMKLAKVYKEDALREYYSLSAYSNMELSTQAVIEDAIKNGIKVTVIDENDQFIRLESNGRVEYVKNGNMTSKDSYISPLIMENKVVTKKVLAEQLQHLMEEGLA